jgi:hypothetical protein
MASEQWADYLDAACEHLHRTRRALEAGRPGPPGPARPSDPPPDHLRGRVQVLAAGYDQLALEVSTRMSALQRFRRSQARPVPPASRFVDRPA